MSEASCRIIDWLSSCGATGDEIKVQQPLSPPGGSLTCAPPAKRKRQTMEDATPRAKRHATGIMTPSNSIGENARTSHFGSNRTPSLKSSTASSRSSSPNKRKRDAEIHYGRPALDFYTRSESMSWKENHASQVPLLEELLQALMPQNPQGRMTPKFQYTLRKIMKEIERCADRKVSEEEFSDSVVLRALRAAKKISRHQEGIEIMNVKTINVWPTTLLPTNERSSKSIPTKRVDYTVGFPVGNRDETYQILRRVENHTLAQSNHPQLCDRALCSHIEIKTEHNTEDPRYQLSTWCAAGFQKQEELWTQRYATTSPPPVPRLAPIPMWVWKTSQVKLWIAVMDSLNAKVHILHEKTFTVDEEDEQSLAKVITAMAAVMDWGRTFYLPWFQSLIGLIPNNGDHVFSTTSTTAPRTFFEPLDTVG